MNSKKSTKQNQGLDETDLKVLEILRRDGRATFAEIAGQLNVSPGMIRQRYNRLVEQGYLKVVAITNPVHRGLKTMALIGVRTDGNQMLKVADKIAKLKEVVYLVVVSGRYETETFMHLKIVKEVYF
jgi:Lrp/AsnC family transcriptional regulator for asnA, asnC and gidA